MRLESSENRHFACSRFMRMSPDCCDSASWFVRICLQDDVTARPREVGPPAAYSVNFRMTLVQALLPPPIRFADSHATCATLAVHCAPASGHLSRCSNSSPIRSVSFHRQLTDISRWSGTVSGMLQSVSTSSNCVRSAGGRRRNWQMPCCRRRSKTIGSSIWSHWRCRHVGNAGSSFRRRPHSNGYAGELRDRARLKCIAGWQVICQPNSVADLMR
jgi:hypothetical protein